EVQEWKQPVIIEEGKERRYPRRASISSFGAGGANAHLIVEEYEPSISASLVAVKDSQQVIVLSAKNEERLQVYAEKLVKYLETTEASLADIAYTLQVGREALEERLALIVSTREELKQKLHQYCQEDLDNHEFYQGNIRKDRSHYTLIQGEEEKSFIGQLISNRKMSKLAELWVTGADVKWSLLSSEGRARRISLPTYPFARESYWVFASIESIQRTNHIDKLHPLVNINTSTLQEQKFETTLTKEEF
ncbi:hypothetical protein CN558_29880, partial [Bacillus wiedmannii]|uniref:KS-MAT linker domain-containing protein n=1 Tax=Bacillus wiedmannii TaxID=1890302 RepID=UPI000BFAD114